MPSEVHPPPPKQSKGRQRAVKKTHDAPSQAVHSDVGFPKQSHSLLQPTDAYGHTSPPSMQAAGTVPSTTPRKRQSRPNQSNAARNGYHSDTGAYSQDSGYAAHAIRQSIDMGAGQTRHMQAPAPYSTTTPTKQQVYAGPAFFASPAASALPMPKGFGKPIVSESDSARPSSGSDASFRSPGPPVEAARGGSPLDMLFKADREEKSRKASGTSSPLAQIQSASRNSTRSAHQRRPGSTPYGTSSKAALMAEMDGTSDQSDSDGIAPNVPFKARMQGLAEHRSTPEHIESDQMQRQAKTYELKQLLMAPTPQIPHRSGPEPPMSAPLHGAFPPQYHQEPPHSQHNFLQSHHRQPSYDHQQAPGGFSHYGPHHGQAQTIRPSAASPSPQDLRNMEENLRKVLKLGPSS